MRWGKYDRIDIMRVRYSARLPGFAGPFFAESRGFQTGSLTLSTLYQFERGRQTSGDSQLLRKFLSTIKGTEERPQLRKTSDKHVSLWSIVKKLGDNSEIVANLPDMDDSGSPARGIHYFVRGEVGQYEVDEFDKELFNVLTH